MTENNHNNSSSSTLQQQREDNTTILERYRASMILAAVGDALGYNNGKWEFSYRGIDIHREFNAMGGINGITIGRIWRVSDDTVMHLATARALVKDYDTLDMLMRNMAKEYVICMEDMRGRAPGLTCIQSARELASGVPWNGIRFSNSGGGCGGSMRATSIGLRYPGEANRDMLIAVGVESGRLTHNHPTGFFGSMVAGAFTALAIEGVDPKTWGKILMEDLLPRAKAYCKQVGRDWNNIQQTMNDFENKWKGYLSERFPNNSTEPVFPENYGIEQRDAFYTKLSFRGWGGASGDDSVIIAYDALLGAGSSWEELVKRGVLHGGDNDSTGIIAAAWWGAIYGFKGVPPNNYEKVEKRAELEDLAQKLYDLAQNKKVAAATDDDNNSNNNTHA